MERMSQKKSRYSAAAVKKNKEHRKNYNDRMAGQSKETPGGVGKYKGTLAKTLRKAQERLKKARGG